MSVPVVVGTVIAERYRVDGILGEGGMGVVVMATHLVLNQRVAIKFLRREAMSDQDAVHRFVREAQAAAKVQSEHVVRVTDVAMLPDGTPYIVMEYLEGQLLATMLASRGALPVREAIKYALQTCEALAETHAAGIVHGDLKPENIYIAGAATADPNAPRRVKLLDFGISKIVFEERRKPNPKSLMGTPAYMAPEQFESGVVNHSSDLWALGVVLYEMLAGQPPFYADTPEEICERVTKEPLTPVLRGDMPQGLDVVIARCLQKEPDLRYPNVLELTAALEDYSPAESSMERLTHVTSKGPHVRVSQRLVPTVVVPNRKTNYGTWLGAAVGVIAIVGLVLVLLGATQRFKREGDSSEPAATTTAPAATTATGATGAVSADPSALASSAAAAIPNPSAGATAPTAAVSIAVSPSASVGKKLRPRIPGTTTKHEPTPTTTPSAAPPAEGDRFGTRK